VEIHNEEINDLLAHPDSQHPQIRDDGAGGVTLAGASEEHVSSQAAALRVLERGSLSRATGSTQMNEHSSRSHAIFTLLITQAQPGGGALLSKFHFVDLAGSERVKRTKATGERFREGISINSGLLALGNVISALSDEKKRTLHVPYRDSKLTRLLQDSLGMLQRAVSRHAWLMASAGGNSRTVMVACVSPADINFEETLSTLKYADRARQIKNKPIINRAPESPETAALRRQLEQLKLELVEARTLGAVGDPTAAATAAAEATAAQRQVDVLREQLGAMTRESALLRSQRDAYRARLVDALGGSLPAGLDDEVMSAASGEGGAGSSSSADDSGIVALQQRIVDQLTAELRARDVQLAQMSVRAVAGTESFRMAAAAAAVATAGLEQDGMGDYSLGGALGGVSDVTDGSVDVAALSDGELETMCVGLRPFSSSSSLCVLMGLCRYARALETLQQESAASRDRMRSEAELTSLGGEIAAKEQLISGLQRSQAELVQLRQQYEQRMRSLEDEIHMLEVERDRAVAEISSKDTVTTEERRRLREQYERQLRALHQQLADHKRRQREMARLHLMQADQARRVESLQSEILHLKQQHVSLTRRARDEARAREDASAEARREMARLRRVAAEHNRVVAQLREENQIKDTMLQKRLEQVQSVQRRLRGRDLMPSAVRGLSPERVDRPASAAASLSMAAAGGAAPVGGAFAAAPAAGGSTLAAQTVSSSAQERRARTLGGDKRGWVHRAIARAVRQREAAEHLEAQLRGRETLLQELQDIDAQRAALLARGSGTPADEAEVAALADRQEAVEEQLRYRAEVIAQAQKDRVAAEAGPELGAAVSALSLADARELARIALEEAAGSRYGEHQRETRGKQLSSRLQQAETALDSAEKARRDAALQLTEQQRQHQLDMCFLYAVHCAGWVF
jgi:kinesin family protein 4/21/27